MIEKKMKKEENKEKVETEKKETKDFRKFLDKENVKKILDNFDQRIGMPTDKPKKLDEKKSDKEIIEELTETLQRLQAEFENYKKRVDKEKTEFVKYAKAELIQRLLPTLDTFEIALKSTKDNERFVKGMEMVYAQFVSTLQSEGLKPIDSIEKKFDPYLHEVMLKEKSDKDDGVILEELQKGYMLNDKVLRHSKVKISEKSGKGGAKKEESNNEKTQ